MGDKPIIFSGPMVRAILDGRKTQTRRVLKPQPRRGWTVWQDSDTKLWLESGYGEAGDDFLNVPYQPGDRLWVRETWAPEHRCDATPVRGEPYDATLLYRERDPEPTTPQWDPFRWRPSIHMPRWASRLTLDVTAVKVEWLQEISQADAIAEGCPMPTQRGGMHPWPEIQFKNLWNNINAKRDGCRWEDNPWIVAVTFKPILANIDSLENPDG